jgi:predicted DNA binding CopG/RHH family protein
MPAKQGKADPMVMTTLRLPRSLLNAAKIRAITDGQTLRELLIDALQQYLKQKAGRQ